MNISVASQSREKLIAQVRHYSLEIPPRRTEDFNIDVSAVVKERIRCGNYIGTRL